MTADPISAPKRPYRKRSGARANHQTINGQVDGTTWRKIREAWTTRLPVDCPRCGQKINPWDPWDLDHLGDPAIFGGRTGPDQLHPAHRTCNRQAGGELRQAIYEAGAAILAEASARQHGIGRTGATIASGLTTPEEVRGFLGEVRQPLATPKPGSPLHRSPMDLSPSEVDDPARIDAPDAPPDPITPGPTDPVWDACPWLAPLLEIPEGATWPRLMSLPHPDAVGSYGPDAEAWLLETRGMELRWWQRLTLYRVLEHDADGTLVWLSTVVSTPRQVGKSVLMAMLALWRIFHAGLFGEEQTVMHTGRDLAVCREVQRPARVWARERALPVREANGQEEIGAGDGSRWLVRAQGAVYGYAVTLGLLDEAWDVAARVVEDGLEPTIAERQSGQVCMFSTAHRRATELIPVVRAEVFASWETPSTTLLVEWSAPAGTDINDREGWRQASPHWSKARERLLEAKLRKIETGESTLPDEHDPVESFRSQYLNVWPRRALTIRGASAPLCSADEWGHLADLYAVAPDTTPVTVGIEDWYGLGAAVCACVRLPDGRALVWGQRFASRVDAYAWAAWVCVDRPGSRVLVGASLSPDQAREHLGDLEVVTANGTTTKAALPLARSVVKAGGLAHNGQEDLATQVSTVRLAASTTGALVIAHLGIRHDLLKAMCWAIADQCRPDTSPPDWFVY